MLGFKDMYILKILKNIIIKDMLNIYNSEETQLNNLEKLKIA